MTIKSRFIEDVPTCSLQKWVFGSSSGPLPDREKPAFIDANQPESHRLTTGDFRLLSKRIALGLMKAGLKPGERVLVYSGNNLLYPCLFLGVLMAGGIFTGTSPHFTARELAHQLRDSDAKYVFVAPEKLPVALEAASSAGISPDRVFLFIAAGDAVLPQTSSTGSDQTNGPRQWTTLVSGNETEANAWDWVEPTDPDSTTCCLNYSSGTTGVPKGVEITHKAYVANCVHVIALANKAPNIEDFRQRERTLCFLPMYHAFAQTYFIAIFPRLRVSVYVMPTYQFETMLRHIERFRITTLVAVPPILVSMSKDPVARKHDLSCIEVIASGAAPMAGEMLEAAGKLCAPEAHVRQGWGMTEMTCYITSWDPTHDSRSTAAVGELMPNTSARLMRLDGTGAITEPRQPGEIWVTGPTLMKGYWRNQRATDETLHVDADGTRWMKTGDVGFVDRYEAGAIFHIVDRVKELIKVKGLQVAPAELEAMLLENEHVLDAAVVGVTINGEEAPRAYVVKSARSDITGEGIASWMEGRVARHKRLKGGVSFVNAVPKNPSGKILRKILKEQAKREVGDRTPADSKI